MFRQIIGKPTEKYSCSSSSVDYNSWPTQKLPGFTYKLLFLTWMGNWYSNGTSFSVIPSPLTCIQCGYLLYGSNLRIIFNNNKNIMQMEESRFQY